MGSNVLVHSILRGSKLLSEQTPGTATAPDILSGETAWVNGVQVTGTMTNQGAKTASLNAGGSYTIPAGYHNGSGKITANSLASQTDGDATAAQILSGKIAYVDGAKVTGSMTNRGAISKTLSPGSSYTIPAGYHNGSGKVTASNMPQASKILYGRIYQLYDNANVSTNYANCNAGDEVWITATAVDVSSTSAASSNKINLKNYNIVGFMTIVDFHDVAPSYYDSSKFELTSTGHLHFTSETALRSYTSSTGTRLAIFYD